MLKMTEDLFYTQLSEMNLSISDKRESGLNINKTPDQIDFTNSDSEAMSFFVEIKRKGDALSKWNCTIFIKNNSTENLSSFQKEYDSYYKILMESKNSLKGIFTDLLKNSEKAIASNTENQNKNDKTPEKQTEKPKTQNTSLPVSTENISGTWQGEEFIDKIIILKGGRGFIILKNGASMNVGVSIADNDGEQFIKIKQTSNSNASYYPEIPRKAALEAAPSASPIEWNLKLTSDNILEGTKTTLIQNQTNIVPGKLDVIWHRTN